MEDENNFNINEISQELENQNDEEKYQYSEESHRQFHAQRQLHFLHIDRFQSWQSATMP